MNGVSITIDAASYLKFLDGAPEKVAKILQNVIYKGSLLVERFGKQNAPVDTGRLRASISTDIHPLTATTSTNTNYARYVHDGTRYMRGRPFMTDAAKSAEGQIGGIIQDELRALD